MLHPIPSIISKDSLKGYRSNYSRSVKKLQCQLKVVKTNTTEADLVGIVKLTDELNTVWNRLEDAFHAFQLGQDEDEACTATEKATTLKLYDDTSANHMLTWTETWREIDRLRREVQQRKEDEKAALGALGGAGGDTRGTPNRGYKTHGEKPTLLKPSDKTDG